MNRKDRRRAIATHLEWVTGYPPDMEARVARLHAQLQELQNEMMARAAPIMNELLDINQAYPGITVVDFEVGEVH